ncbi:unnamed protein product [Owenia fusiformis]|uniref:Uncharacterized protein n=1 Tax=Owenia fusiformis TaxID=6347 RepID=A0A8J1U3C8_OWEFU|nr:unnamed protein product [Owenia fusiformis]
MGGPPAQQPQNIFKAGAPRTGKNQKKSQSKDAKEFQKLERKLNQCPAFLAAYLDRHPEALRKYLSSRENIPEENLGEDVQSDGNGSINYIVLNIGNSTHTDQSRHDSPSHVSTIKANGANNIQVGSGNSIVVPQQIGLNPSFNDEQEHEDADHVDDDDAYILLEKPPSQNILDRMKTILKWGKSNNVPANKRCASAGDVSARIVQPTTRNKTSTQSLPPGMESLDLISFDEPPPPPPPRLNRTFHDCSQDKDASQFRDISSRYPTHHGSTQSLPVNATQAANSIWGFKDEFMGACATPYENGLRKRASNTVANQQSTGYHVTSCGRFISSPDVSLPDESSRASRCRRPIAQGAQRHFPVQETAI